MTAAVGRGLIAWDAVLAFSRKIEELYGRVETSSIPSLTGTVTVKFRFF